MKQDPTLEPYQAAASDWISRRRRGLVIAPAGSGKTIIAAAALARVIKAKKRDRCVSIGWLCNTLEQAEQAEVALAGFSALRDMARWEVSCAAAGEDWREKDVLIVDECHHGPADSWASQIATARGAVWGFTATPDTGETQRDVALVDLFAGQLYRVKREDVSNRLVQARVILLPDSDPDTAERVDEEVKGYMKRFAPGWRRNEVNALLARIKSGSMSEREGQARLGEIRGQLKSMAYWQAVNGAGIAFNTARTQAAVRVGARHILAGDRVLLLVNRVEHGQGIVEDLASQGAVAKLANAKMGKRKRAEALQAIRDGTLGGLVATSLADEGLDLPAINVLVLVSGGRSKIKAEQRTGRALRSFSGKTHATIYDFQDTCHRLMEKHSQARQSLYRQLGYKIEGELG